MKKINQILWDFLSICAIVIIFCMVISKFQTGWSSIFSYRIFFVVSESMEPEIGVNDLVIGKYVPEDEELQIGEIYTYRRDGAFGKEIIIHRLIDITEDGRYQFQGDNNKYPDAELIEREEIGYCLVWY